MQKKSYINLVSKGKNVFGALIVSGGGGKGGYGRSKLMERERELRVGKKGE